MAELHDRLQDLRVSASSLDKTVTITAQGAPAEIEVFIARGSLRTHTKESFERQVNGAIRIVMTAYRQAATNAWEKAAGVTEDDE